MTEKKCVDIFLSEVLNTYGVYISSLKATYKLDFYVNVLEANDGFKIISANMKIFNKNYKPVVTLSKINEIMSVACNCKDIAESPFCDHILLLLDKYHDLITKGTPKEDIVIRVEGNITYHEYPANDDNRTTRYDRIYIKE